MLSKAHLTSHPGCLALVQPLLLTLDEGYLLMAAPPDLEPGVAPHGPPVPVQPPLLEPVIPNLYL